MKPNKHYYAYNKDCCWNWSQTSIIGIELELILLDLVEIWIDGGNENYNSFIPLCKEKKTPWSVMLITGFTWVEFYLAEFSKFSRHNLVDIILAYKCINFIHTTLEELKWN